MFGGLLQKGGSDSQKEELIPQIIDGSLRTDDGDWHFSADGFPALATPPLLDQAEPGDACLGVRPEHVHLGDGDREGKVQLVEQTGHENIVVLALAGGLRLTGRTPSTQLLHAGDTVKYRIDESAVHVFAAGDRGQRLNAPLPA